MRLNTCVRNSIVHRCAVALSSNSRGRPASYSVRRRNTRCNFLLVAEPYTRQRRHSYKEQLETVWTPLNRRKRKPNEDLAPSVRRAKELAPRCKRGSEHTRGGDGQSARRIPTCLFDNSMGKPINASRLHHCIAQRRGVDHRRDLSEMEFSDCL